MECVTITNSRKLGDDHSAHSPTTALGKIGKRSREDSPSSEESRDNLNLGETHVSRPVGWNDGLDLVDEDMLRSHESKAIGFVGQDSEVQWSRGLNSQLQSADELPYGPPRNSNEAVTQRINALHAQEESSKLGSIMHAADFTPHLDSDAIDVDAVVVPYELPPPEIAERSIDRYM